MLRIDQTRATSCPAVGKERRAASSSFWSRQHTVQTPVEFQGKTRTYLQNGNRTLGRHTLECSRQICGLCGNKPRWASLALLVYTYCTYTNVDIYNDCIQSIIGATANFISLRATCTSFLQRLGHGRSTLAAAAICGPSRRKFQRARSSRGRLGADQTSLQAWRGRALTPEAGLGAPSRAGSPAG